MTGPVVVPLARALLRTARRYDRNPAMRVLLATPRQIGYDMIKADWVPNPAPPPTKPADIAAKVASDAISSVCAGARLYSDGTEGLTVQRALSSAIRQALVASPPYEPAALADAAFGLLRRLDAGVALGERVLGPSPSPPPAGWPAISRHASERPPAAGDLLVSHPLLRRDVVLVLSAHDDGGYAFGLVTNAPTSATLGAGQMLSRGRDGGGGGGGGGAGAGAGAGAGGDVNMWTTGSRQLDGPGETEEYAPLAAARRVRDHDIGSFAEHTIFYGGPDGK